jgi:hypothetical protein
MEALIEHFDVRLPRNLFDQVQKIRIRGFRLRLVHLGQQGCLDHIRAKTAPLQPRRDSDKDMQVALLKFFDVPGCGRVGDNDLPGQIIRHILADLQKISRNDFGTLVIFCPFGLWRFILLGARRIQPGIWKLRDDPTLMNSIFSNCPPQALNYGLFLRTLNGIPRDRSRGSQTNSEGGESF